MSVSPSEDLPETLPVEISDDEHLARAFFHPYHISSKGKIKPAAFKAPFGRVDVSVNRLLALDFSECKKLALSIGAPSDFKGFAVLKAEAVRSVGLDVVDSREECYWGHADIMHKVALERGEPAPPGYNRDLKTLAKAVNFFPDPAPTVEGWAGGSL